MEEICHGYVEVAHAFLECLIAKKSKEDTGHTDGGEDDLADEDGSAFFGFVN